MSPEDAQKLIIRSVSVQDADLDTVFQLPATTWIGGKVNWWERKNCAFFLDVGGGSVFLNFILLFSSKHCICIMSKKCCLVLNFNEKLSFCHVMFLEINFGKKSQNFELESWSCPNILFLSLFYQILSCVLFISQTVEGSFDCIYLLTSLKDFFKDIQSYL